MSMLNRAEFIGNLGRDPELTYTPNGKAVAKFSLAVNNWRGGGGTSGASTGGVGERRPEGTLWLNVVAWERLADTCSEYLHKGAKVYAAGRLQVREFTRQDGSKGTAVELILADMQMLDSRVPASPSGATGATDDAAEAIPF